MKKLFAIFLIALGFSTLFIEAQAKSFNLEKFYLAARFGRGWTKYLDVYDTMDTKGRGMLGAFAVGYHDSKELRYEAEFFFDDGLKAQKVSLSRVGLTVKVKTLGALINGYYDFPNRTKFTPYASAGLGWLQNKISETRTGSAKFNGMGSATRSSFAWQLGAGVSYAVSKNVAIDLGYRYLDRAKRNFKVYNANGSTAILQIKPVHVGLLGVRISF
jgi:opacity protein-like surface antigen